MEEQKISVFFNFRSPYCYLISKSLFDLMDDFHVSFDWRPLGGWDGRSDPERAKKKVPLTRQDVARWCRRMGIPMNPPPITTDPTRVACGSVHVEKTGGLRGYVVEAMRLEWAEGLDIGQTEVIEELAARCGLDKAALLAACDDEKNLDVLKANAAKAAEINVIGVPTLVIDDQVYWGNDRLDFVREELVARGLRRL